MVGSWESILSFFHFWSSERFVASPSFHFEHRSSGHQDIMWWAKDYLQKPSYSRRACKWCIHGFFQPFGFQFHDSSQLHKLTGAGADWIATVFHYSTKRRPMQWPGIDCGQTGDCSPKDHNPQFEGDDIDLNNYFKHDFCQLWLKVAGFFVTLWLLISLTPSRHYRCWCNHRVWDSLCTQRGGRLLCSVGYSFFQYCSIVGSKLVKNTIL